jgi:feruloyl esterase
LLALAGVALIGAAPEPDKCAALRDLRIQGVSIDAAVAVAGSFRAPDDTVLDVPPLCRVRGVARPTPASRITFELWLPARGWNGRYYQLGNGGFAGNIHLPSLAAEVARGNAAAVTDTGHSAGQFDARWAAGQPELIVDYGHRSIKATSDAARALITAYYGRPPSRRYFAGCSNGGRQALKAAQLYPGDWDGVIAGAPFNPFTEQLTSFAALQQRLRTVPGAWIPPAKLPAIQRAALSSCPAGSVLGAVAADPRLCRFDPDRLLCRDAETDACLTAPQVMSLRRIVAAGFQATSAAAGGWSQWIVNPDPAAPSQLTFATQAFRHLLQSAPGWELARFDARRDASSPAVRSALDAAPDFRRFRERGGKIISYFGWADGLISPGMGLNFYREVRRNTGGAPATRSFYRLFMVPGMAHCQGGPGADAFGQSIPAPALKDDRHHDIRRALEAWVEQRIAPEMLVASKRSGNSPAATRILRPEP